MRGPSYQDCQKSFARTGIPSESLKRRNQNSSSLVQIRGLEAASFASVPRF